MMSYRFKRRAFLSSIGGAMALKVMLRNFEAMATEARPPARFLMTHWPVGTIKYLFLPNGGALPQGVGTITEWSPILQPFQTAGLANDMTLIFGLGSRGSAGGGGGHEAGTPMMTTGTSCPGTRQNGGEGDDGVAGGPSWDQIFLREVKDDPNTGAVSMQGGDAFGYRNAICDARIDSQETSTRCLSYGYDTQEIQSVNPGGIITEHVPLLPTLSPFDLWGSLFTNFMPGGPTPSNMETARRALLQRKSVLDYCLRELAQLKTLAPAAEAKKIEIHEAVCRKVEMQLSDLLNGEVTTPSGCVVPERADESLVGGGSKTNYDYGDPKANSADDEIHHQIGLHHARVLLAAMQCDLIRVATFQWSPGTNHVSFAGQFPGEPSAIYMHHPLSHKINGVPASDFYEAAPSPSLVRNNFNVLQVVQFLANVQTWYNEKTAEIVNMFKEAEDPLVPGGKMLDRTIITYTTEVAHQDHDRRTKPAFIFGGRALGMQLGKYVNFPQGRAEVDLWATVAQAFFQSSDPMQYLGHLQFASQPAPISGLWVKPT